LCMPGPMLARCEVPHGARLNHGPGDGRPIPPGALHVIPAARTSSLADLIAAVAPLVRLWGVPHIASDGRPIVEPATPGTMHLFELARGLTAAPSPAIGVEVRVGNGERVRLVHWLRGQPFRTMTVTGQA
jgi:hypothetical protein